LRNRVQSRVFSNIRIASALVLLFVGAIVHRAAAQDSQPDTPDTIHGVVMNSVTREPISRALVASPDNHFATMTDGQGHFEFVLPKAESGPPGSNRPTALLARKPGYLTEPNFDPQLDVTTQDVSLLLTPEAHIVGHIELPSGEGAGTITVEIFRRQVEEGRARWVPVAQATTRSTGEFRFADLAAGTYKLFTHELLDRDQPVLAPDSVQLYGYAPVYFPAATDFAASDPITLTPGQTFEADLAVTRQPYYQVRVPVAGLAPDSGVAVSVSPQGGHSPGYTLGYNPQSRRIEGLLPQGNYSVEVVGFGSPTVAGELNLAVRDVPSAARMTMVATRPIPINVKEEFTSEQPDNAESNLRGPGRYLNVRLEPADEFNPQNVINMRPPSNQNDHALVLEGAPPGKYWVHIDSSRGYAASVISGGVDLLRKPLVVAEGASSPSIEITMRDDGAQIDGTIEGADPALTASNVLTASLYGINPPGAHTMFAYVYCVPMADSPGRFTEAVASPDGAFTALNLPPGTYRVLAFKRPQSDLEYQNSEAMQAYETKGEVVHLAGGKTEHMTLQLTAKGD